MRDGIAYELPRPAHLTSVSDSSSLPTPTAADAVRGPDYARADRDGSGGDDLVTTVAKLLPTPLSRDYKGCNPNPRGIDLNEAVRRTVDSETLPTLPTPIARDHKGAGRPGQLGTVLLPTPLATDGDKGSPKQRSSSGAPLLPGAVLNLMPTPTAVQYGYNQSPSSGAAIRPSLNSMAAQEIDWGKYEPAIRRWEAVLDRPAPSPTEIGPRGNKRLSPYFVEWMMGIPDGWVTEFGFARKHLFRLLGNGVVPQQAALAIGGLLADHFQGEELEAA